MTNYIKQVYASLYIDEDELKLLIGEYYNTRFNIIRAEKIKIDGILNHRIVDEEKLLDAISKLISQASAKLGAAIKKVILVLPAVNYKRVPLRVSLIPNGGVLTKKDVARALSSSLKTEVDEDLIIANACISRYIVNGISTRRLPENEVAEEVLIDIDLLCSDKQLAYEYISLCSKAGIEVLDISLNNYSICKEAVLLEQSLNENIILLDISNPHTSLSLLTKGKLASSEIVGDGFNFLITKLKEKLDISYDVIDRLLKYNVNFESEYLDDAVFAWTKEDGKESYSITVRELNDLVRDPLDEYIDKLLTMCKPIIDSGKTSFFVVGEGSKMTALCSELKKKSGVEVKSYYPDTIGIRDSAMCAVYGSFFVYREKAVLNEMNVTCVDSAEYDQTVDHKKVDVEGESITMKIKKLFETYRDKED